jgi:hypothetical protein
MIVKDSFLEQSAPWEEITRGHVEAIWAAVKYFFKLVADHMADEASSGALYSELFVPAPDELRETTHQRTTELLLPHQRGRPIK